MGLDIRMPIGLMFSIFGGLLMIYGLVSDKAIYERSLGFNMNIWWGLALLVFGGVMLYLSRRGASAMRPAETTPEGRATEIREKATHLESRNPITDR